jgi:hypothetical protein
MSRPSLPLSVHETADGSPEPHLRDCCDGFLTVEQLRWIADEINEQHPVIKHPEHEPILAKPTTPAEKLEGLRSLLGMLIEDGLMQVQSGAWGIPTADDLAKCGQLHVIRGDLLQLGKEHCNCDACQAGEGH